MSSNFSFIFALFLSIVFAVIDVRPPIPLSEQSISSTPSLTTASVSSVQTLVNNDLPSTFESVLRTELLRRVDTLAKITEDPASPGITRPYLSTAGKRARRVLMDMMRASGLRAWVDPVGNVLGDMRCMNLKTKRDMLLIASHFDTVPNGGKWDGVYGVVAGIAVAQVLSSRICSLPFDIRIAAFDDEEGASGFGVTNAGARAFTGSLNVSSDIADTNGFSRRFATVLGHDISNVDILVRSAAIASENTHYVAALELHIEQGPVLQKTGHSTAAVSAIAGQTRLRATWKGLRGHAGTVPMAGRRDSLTAAARAVLYVESIGNAQFDGGRSEGVDLVATVGLLDVLHSGSNVIAGEVSMSVDIRAPKDTHREDAVRDVIKGFKKIASDTGVQVEVEILHQVKAIPMEPWITRVLSKVVDAPRPLVSGAGHDSQFLAKIAHTGMLFVRCRDGISHSPEEFVSDEDAHRGALVLLRAVEAIAKERN